MVSIFLDNFHVVVDTRLDENDEDSLSDDFYSGR